MILETNEDDYARLLLGKAPRDLRLADTDIAPPEVLAMLFDLARRVGADFSPPPPGLSWSKASRWDYARSPNRPAEGSSRSATASRPAGKDEAAPRAPSPRLWPGPKPIRGWRR